MGHDWAVTVPAVRKQEGDTGVCWKAQPSHSFHWGHLLQNALVSSLNLNRDLVCENNSNQTCLKLLLTFYTQSLGTTFPKT